MRLVALLFWHRCDSVEEVYALIGGQPPISLTSQFDENRDKPFSRVLPDICAIVTAVLPALT
ncbi:hypothetical protein [Lysinibacillus sp. OL1_EC]|uniref:hypothetical protein n=1 Tax=Lysinibacillus sp. OL1_EC TaxID=2943493 RepID=UPI00202EA785|nr:hypothetical protein [Lysinibacillus sp. OL1_EC]